MALKDIISQAQNPQPSTAVSAVVQVLNQHLATTGKPAFASKQSAGYALGLEGFADDAAAMAHTEQAVR